MLGILRGTASGKMHFCVMSRNLFAIESYLIL